MKITKKLLAAFLCTAMVCTVMPGSESEVFAKKTNEFDFLSGFKTSGTKNTSDKKDNTKRPGSIDITEETSVKTGDCIQGEHFDENLSKGVIAASEGEGGNLGYIQNGDYGGYAGINFGDNVNTFYMSTSKPNVLAYTMEIRLDSPKGTLIGEYNSPKTETTGSWNDFIDVAVPLYESPEGVHDLYLVFKSDNSGYLLDIDYFWFDSQDAGKGKTGNRKNSSQIRSAFSTIEGEDLDKEKSSNCKEAIDGNAKALGYIKNDSYACYADLDFKDGADQFTMHTSKPNKLNYVMELHVGDADGTLIGSYRSSKKEQTKAWDDFYDVTFDLSKKPTGVNDLYIVFKSDSTSYLMNIDYFTFK